MTGIAMSMMTRQFRSGGRKRERASSPSARDNAVAKYSSNAVCAGLRTAASSSRPAPVYCCRGAEEFDPVCDFFRDRRGDVSRQINFEYRAYAWFAVKVDKSPVALDDAQRSGKPKPVPLPGALVLKNRSNIFSRISFGSAGASVIHGYAYIRAGPGFQIHQAGGGFIQPYIFQAAGTVCRLGAWRRAH